MTKCLRTHFGEFSRQCREISRQYCLASLIPRVPLALGALHRPRQAAHRARVLEPALVVEHDAPVRLRDGVDELRVVVELAQSQDLAFSEWRNHES